jgi:hypothetical protein
MTKEEVLAAIRQCARKLGRNPTQAELWQMAAISESRVRKRFGSFGQAFREAGLEPAGPGHIVSKESLLKDWAAVARKLAKLPSKNEYKWKGRYSPTPFDSRWSTWRAVPEAFHRYARESGTAMEWADVLGMIEAKRPAIVGREEDECETESVLPGSAPGTTAKIPGPGRQRQPGAFERRKLCGNKTASLSRRPLLPGRPVYGAPLLLPGLAHEPVNEAGVVYVFGMVAHRLGFVVERMQSSFPDCEAMREVQPGRWQRVRIEFEFESRNFVKHGHSKAECDLIVCWIHNWPECPGNLEVIELRRITKRL